MHKPYYSGAFVWSYLTSSTFSSWRLDFDFLQPSQALKISSHSSNLNLSFDRYQLSTYLHPRWGRLLRSCQPRTDDFQYDSSVTHQRAHRGILLQALELGFFVIYPNSNAVLKYLYV